MCAAMSAIGVIARLQFDGTIARTLPPFLVEHSSGQLVQGTHWANGRLARDKVSFERGPCVLGGCPEDCL